MFFYHSVSNSRCLDNRGGRLGARIDDVDDQYDHSAVVDDIKPKNSTCISLNR